MSIINNKFSLSKKEKNKHCKNVFKEIESIDEKIIEIHLYEKKLKKISNKLNSVINLANKIKIENNKTNNTMINQDKNFKHIDFLIQEEISIIDKLSINITSYKTNLDKNIEKFEYNKCKLLEMVNFIKEIKDYISDTKQSSNTMKSKSESILDISQTIKKISDNSKILSINAQIEASTIASNRNGFEIISDEMNKMANYTKENSILIDNTINTIILDIENLNENVTKNVNKIEESIALCEIIVDFVEALSDEYKSNIKMFNKILESMTDIILFIENIQSLMHEGYAIADEVFKNTSTEYIYIEGLLESSLECKNETLLPKEITNKLKIYDNEKISLLLNPYKEFSKDPLLIKYHDESMICKNIYNTLFKESKFGTPIPILAKGWTDNNSKEWTVYLKNNIFFSNGEKLKAEDIEFSIKRSFLVKNFDEPHLLNNLEGFEIFDNEKDMINSKIKGIEIINDTTIKFKLIKEDILFLSKLASPSTLIISKKEYISNNNFIGTGPYYIESINKIDKHKSSISLKSNKYSKIFSSYIKHIEIIMDTNFDSYLNNVLEGKIENEFDIIYPLPYLKAHTFQNKDWDFNIISGNSHFMLIANFISLSKNELVQNKDYRQSIFSILKNMDLTIDGASNYYIRTNSLSDNLQDESSIPEWIYDKPKFEKLKGELNIVTYTSVYTLAICDKIKDTLEKRGLKVNIHINDKCDSFDKFDLSVGTFYSDSNDIYNQLFDTISPPFGSFLQDTPIEKSLLEIFELSNYKTKINCLRDFEIDLLKEYYNLPICYIKSYLIKRKNITNIDTNDLLNLKLDNIIKVSNK